MQEPNKQQTASGCFILIDYDPDYAKPHRRNLLIKINLHLQSAARRAPSHHL